MYHYSMNEDDIKKRTRQHFLPEPHRTVLDAALAGLINSAGEGFVKVTKRNAPDGTVALTVEVSKQLHD